MELVSEQEHHRDSKNRCIIYRCKQGRQQCSRPKLYPQCCRGGLCRSIISGSTGSTTAGECPVLSRDPTMCSCNYAPMKHQSRGQECDTVHLWPTRPVDRAALIIRLGQPDRSLVVRARSPLVLLEQLFRQTADSACLLQPLP
jgi:hypothetical protein